MRKHLVLTRLDNWHDERLNCKRMVGEVRVPGDVAKIEKRLRDEVERLRYVYKLAGTVEQSANAVVFVNPAGYIEYVNP